MSELSKSECAKLQPYWDKEIKKGDWVYSKDKKINKIMGKHVFVPLTSSPMNTLWEHGVISKYDLFEFLGILNGIFGINENGYGCIVAAFDDDTHKLKRFYTDYEGKNIKEEK